MKQIELPPRWQHLLVGLPETGMGYQIVDITMNDGTSFERKTVLNCSTVELAPGEDLDAEQIMDIELSEERP